MARLARVEVFAADEVAIVHVINRTVRRCFLMGDDPLTRKNYDHRKTWMERELEHLARFFSIDLLCYAIMTTLRIPACSTCKSARPFRSGIRTPATCPLPTPTTLEPLRMSNASSRALRRDLLAQLRSMRHHWRR